MQKILMLKQTEHYHDYTFTLRERESVAIQIRAL